jgi:cysteinyl-tRNA synthetase
MPLFLMNSLTRRKEPFVPQDPKRVTMYVCGPTVYSYAHIGNARPPVVFDVLFRLLRLTYGEAHVVYARNFTDIDDRIIKAANETGRPIGEITRKFEDIYVADNDALGVLRPTHGPRATEHVGGMVDIIERLIACGCAYRAQSGVYFCVAEDGDYGKLSGRTPDDLDAQARIDGEEDKRASADFALWKAAKPGEPQWEAPFGAGRPGWHIECSAMIEAVLGGTIDIHGGGVDLVFPHHENEIAQSETAFGRPLARVWLHNGFLTMDSEKMSKSLGNVRLVHELVKRLPPEVLRMALLSAHYRAPLDWTDALVDQTRASLNRLYGSLLRLKDVPSAADAPVPANVLAAVEDDLNTPEALAALFQLAGEANKAEKPAEQAKLKAALLKGGALLGLLQQDPDAWFRGDEAEAARIDGLVAARVAARQTKNWAEADRLRAALAAEGVEVLDGPQGSTWRRIG